MAADSRSIRVACPGSTAVAAGLMLTLPQNLSTRHLAFASLVHTVPWTQPSLDIWREMYALIKMNASFFVKEGEPQTQGFHTNLTTMRSFRNTTQYGMTDTNSPGSGPSKG